MHFTRREQGETRREAQDQAEHGRNIPQFERPAVVVNGVRMDNERLIPDHGNVQRSFEW